MTKGFAEAIYNAVKDRKNFVIATVVSTSGSSIGKPGFKEVISEEGEILYGTLGGACPDSVIVEKAKEVLKIGKGKKITIFLENPAEPILGTKKNSEDEIHVETFCGGSMEIFLDPIKRPERLIIIGQGGRDEIEDSLIRLGREIGMSVVLIDPNPQVMEKPDEIYDPVTQKLEDFNFSKGDYVVILTKGLKDIDVLEKLSGKELSYIGLLASRKRIETDISLLRGKVNDDFIKSLHAPIGLDIGAITPEEIAVSIIGEIISVRRSHNTKS
ncbi:MAG: XdhC family protein [Thermoplasmatales archaeon]